MKSRTVVIAVMAALAVILTGMPMSGSAADAIFMNILVSRQAAKAAKVNQCLDVFTNYWNYRGEDNAITSRVCECADVCMAVQKVLHKDELDEYKKNEQAFKQEFGFEAVSALTAEQALGLDDECHDVLIQCAPMKTR